MAMYRTADFKGPLMRVSYAQNLFVAREQKKDDGSTKQEWGATFIIPTADTAGLKMLQDKVAEVVTNEWGPKGVERFKSGLIKNPILLGDGKEARNKESGELHPGMGADVRFIRAKSNRAVKVFNAKVLPATQDAVWSGYWGYPVLCAFAWHNAKNGDGISFGIEMFQVIKADETLGGAGGANPDDFFKAETISTSDEGNASGGAAGMFD